MEKKYAYVGEAWNMTHAEMLMKKYKILQISGIYPNGRVELCIEAKENYPNRVYDAMTRCVARGW